MGTFADIRIMARGWDHEAWVAQGFYPDDLPEDWRLPYYANEFRAVLVPDEVWRAANEDVIQTWLDDAPEAFQFFLELADVSGNVQPVISVARALGHRLGGFLCRWEVLPQDWEATIHALQAFGPVGLLPAPNTVTQGVDRCWRLNDEIPTWGAAPVCFAWVDGDMAYTPRQWREKMERLRDASQGRTVVLVFDGLPPDIEAMRVVSAINEMLGPLGNGTQ